MRTNRLFCAGLVLGLGFGGFFDGIVLHQILGWHHLICRTDTCQPTSIASLQQQNQEDGCFHLVVWMVSLLGTALLFRARTERGDARSLTGAMLAGWGGFNVVEGLVDHQLLGVHHVLPGSPHELLYDLLFLGSGLMLGGISAWIHRREPTPFRRVTLPGSGTTGRSPIPGLEISRMMRAAARLGTEGLEVQLTAGAACAISTPSYHV